MNTSRGHLRATDALLSALTDGRIAGDVRALLAGQPARVINP